jgi:hypothetical protein
MLSQITIIGVFAALLAALIAVVRSNGKKAERLRAMREMAEREAKERERASKITDNVGSMDDDTVRARLRRVSQGHNRNGLQ